MIRLLSVKASDWQRSAINIFKFTVLMGTFALAMAFAGNDLVNFIGVPCLSFFQKIHARGLMTA